MRIRMIAPPWFPLPPSATAASEFVVSLLTEGLVAAATTSRCSPAATQNSRPLSYIFDRAPYDQMENGAHLEVMHSLAAYKRSGIRHHSRS